MIIDARTGADRVTLVDGMPLLVNEYVAVGDYAGLGMSVLPAMR
ncbi:hypothetical protein [Catellatospora sp. TT07R-123]|nr:hypothetical protein [Catellatospora sp. TT07R-123]